MSDLATLLFKDYRRRVLGLLLLHPDEAYHVREIARLTATVAGTLHRELSRLSEAGVLLKQPRGNQLLYQANRACPVFEELAGILRKTSGLVDVLAEGFLPLADNIAVALVFGSMASGKATSTSDVDLLVLGEVDFAEVVKCVYPLQQTLGREINPKVYSLNEWRGMLAEKRSFACDVMDKPKLFVIGNLHDLG